MTSGGPTVERLREYLKTLKPDARAMLVAELERELLRGEVSAGNEFILQELRRIIRAAAQPVPRIGDAARMFFMPLEPFLVNGNGDYKRMGRLARGWLEPVWQWISRDLMPAEAKALSEDINRALLANDRNKADQLVRALHDRAILRMKDAVAAVGTDEKARRRFAVQVGAPRAIEDVETLIGILEIRDVLAELGRRLPSHIRNFDQEQIAAVRMQIDAATASKSLEGVDAKTSDVLLYGLVMVMSRLSSPWQLVRMASRGADGVAAARIGETPYAAAIAVVMSELECVVHELRTEFKAGRPITSLLRELHDAVRGLRTELDLSADSAWSRQLATVRSAVSNLLKQEIDAAPAKIRRLLRPRPAKEIEPGAVLDPIDVEDAETKVIFVSGCRQYAAELALSEVTLRAYSDLTQYLETTTKVLLDTLRHSEEADRPFRQSQVDAAIRFCGTIFGTEYAGLLAKAADVAVQAAPVERKSLRA